MRPDLEGWSDQEEPEAVDEIDAGLDMQFDQLMRNTLLETIWMIGRVQHISFRFLYTNQLML